MNFFCFAGVKIGEGSISMQKIGEKSNIGGRAEVGVGVG